MEQLWVALLALGTTLFSSGIDGSVLHGVAGGPGYLELIPHELIYPNFNSPVVLSQLHGLRIDEALALHANGPQQSPSAVDETLAVTTGNGGEQSPAPVVENSAQINKNNVITQDQLYEQIFGRNLGSSEINNGIESGVTSTGVETVMTSSVKSEIQAPPSVADLLVPQSKSEASSVPSSVQPSVQSENQAPPSVADLLVPQSQSEASSVPSSVQSSVQSGIQTPSSVADLLVPQSQSEVSSVQSSVSPIPNTPEQESSLPAGAIPNNSVGGVYINAEEGKLQMQASLLSGGEGLQVSIGDVAKLDGDSVAVPVIIPELSASGIAKESKPHIFTNVNVNVNVNGDGKGSVINSTSVAEIISPIKPHHKKCD